VHTISSFMFEPTLNSEGAFGTNNVKTGDLTPSVGFSITKW